MNLSLTTQITMSGEDGIFSFLISEDSSYSAVTIEHAFLVGKYFIPKIPEGEYPCIRGIHHLRNTKYPDIEPNEFVDIETFEITGIPDFMGKKVTGCVFHPANYNEELEGCIAPGKGFGNRSSGGKMICNSVKSFKELMNLQAGVDEFILSVRR